MTTNQQDAMEAAAKAFHLNKPDVCEVPWDDLPERARQSLMGNAYDVVTAYLAAMEAQGFAGILEAQASSHYIDAYRLLKGGGSHAEIARRIADYAAREVQEGLKALSARPTNGDR